MPVNRSVDCHHFPCLCTEGVRETQWIEHLENIGLKGKSRTMGVTSNLPEEISRASKICGRKGTVDVSGRNPASGLGVERGDGRCKEERVDSIMLLEEGFTLVSSDASDKMLKYALKERWNRRKEEAFDNWVIEEANWLTLPLDIPKPGDGFDAVICLGNSFAHLPDFKGDQSEQKLALSNIASMVKPGGILIIDHRNYDAILETGHAPKGKNIYYQSDLTKDINTSVLYVNNKPHMVTLDYTVHVPNKEEDKQPEVSTFRLSYYPHRVDAFTELLKSAFHGRCQHTLYGDFKPHQPGQDYTPCYFIHVVKRMG
ncbi:glycine N-methyltransferase isoform X1 [Pristis pectinata]|uniref:glycine N-methyltransferase isoform X1 n=1 Tax=Pristis pectinata TaxID=685728 RepID=UPI00223DBB67|nr:glycine N-methyltransferase isoform X1 [Pristis pectinata]